MATASPTQAPMPLSTLQRSAPAQGLAQAPPNPSSSPRARLILPSSSPQARRRSVCDALGSRAALASRIQLTMWYFGTHGEFVDREKRLPTPGPGGLAAYDPDGFRLLASIYGGTHPRLDELDEPTSRLAPLDPSEPASQRPASPSPDLHGSPRSDPTIHPAPSPLALPVSTRTHRPASPLTCYHCPPPPALALPSPTASP